MIGRSELSRVARATGFRLDGVEKVLHLVGILKRLGDHELSSGKWLLKGGTAINLLYLPLPRLSVDIDLNFVGVADLEHLGRARLDFERALVSCCERQGCRVRRTPSEHAGGKLRLSFRSALGGTQKLEVDVSYVARIPILPAVLRRSLFPPGTNLEVPTLALEELAAGKFADLVARAAARDVFDAAGLIEREPDLLRRPAFRLCFVCQAASSRIDVRTVGTGSPALDRRGFEQQLLPLLRAEGAGAPASFEGLRSRLTKQVSSAVRDLLDWTDKEKMFLDTLLDHGEIEPEHLTTDVLLQERIRRQPMLLWKRRHVRGHLSLEEERVPYVVRRDARFRGPVAVPAVVAPRRAMISARRRVSVS